MNMNPNPEQIRSLPFPDVSPLLPGPREETAQAGGRSEQHTLQMLICEINRTQDELRNRVHALETSLADLRLGIREAASGCSDPAESHALPEDNEDWSFTPRSERHMKPSGGLLQTLFQKK